MRNLLCTVGVVVASLLAASCGSSSSTTPANIRLVNTTGVAVSMTLNSVYELSAPSDTASVYESIPPGTYSLSASSSGLSSSTQTVGLGTAENYTTIAFLRGSTILTSTITDNLATPASGSVTLDVANVSIDAGPLDVYLLQGTTSLQGQTPSFSSVQGLTTAETFSAGTYNIIVTATGNQSDVRFSYTGYVFSYPMVGTLALTDTSGGTLVNANVITQGGGIDAIANTQARVRVMPALPSTPTSEVLVTVGTTTLAPSYSGIPTEYALVGAGAVIASVTVGGTAISTALPTTALASGQDYSILVYGDGTAAGTTAVLLADSNLVIPNQASVRVINGAATATIAPGGVTLFVEGKEPVFGVLYGTASSYAGVAPNSSATVQLIGGTYNETVPSYNFISGDVYTVFLYDSTQPPLITEDR